MAEVDVKQVNGSSRMKWDASLTFDGSNLPRTGIEEGDRSSRSVVRVSHVLSRWKLVRRSNNMPLIVPKLLPLSNKNQRIGVRLMRVGLL